MKGDSSLYRGQGSTEIILICFNGNLTERWKLQNMNELPAD